MKSRKLWLILASLFSLALIAAACGSDDDDSGDDPTPTTAAPAPTTAAPAPTEAPASMATEQAPDVNWRDMDLSGRTVTVFGSESTEDEAGALHDALDVFSESSGIDIFFAGARDFSDLINAQATAGSPPDIGIFPQPGKVADFARDGLLLPLPGNIADAAQTNWPQAWNDFGTVDGVQFGVPNKSDLKSLVWYQPARFEANGYEVPETWADFLALANQMIADGNTPLCVGIESGPATGWPFTDWIEDIMLRTQTPEFYDQWVNHDVPFNSQEVKDVWQEVLDLWNTEGAVFAAGGSIEATPFGANGSPLVEGDCMMHRQASFFAAFLPDGTPYADGSEEAVDVFYFPSRSADERPALVAGTVAAAFRDAPEVWAVMEYFSTAEYANERQKAQQKRKKGSLSGFLSAAIGQDMDNYLPLEQSFINILGTANIARFDASDLMPSAVGSGSFWTEGTSAVAGEKSVDEATAAIEASWP